MSIYHCCEAKGSIYSWLCLGGWQGHSVCSGWHEDMEVNKVTHFCGWQYNLWNLMLRIRHIFCLGKMQQCCAESEAYEPRTKQLKWSQQDLACPGLSLQTAAVLIMFISCVAEIGVGLVGFGAFFLLFGMLLYMDSVLLAFGNVSSCKLPDFFSSQDR